MQRIYRISILDGGVHCVFVFTLTGQRNEQYECVCVLFFQFVYVKVTEDLKHLCFFLKKLISRQREAPESASFNLIPITHNIKGLDVQICLRGSPGGEI